MADCHEVSAGPSVHADRPGMVIAFAGNPNCGKTALFNAFTGFRQRTGNWPGVTVDRTVGEFKLDGRTTSVVDLPGIYSLDAGSLDEEVTRRYLLSREADLIVNVVDAGNLERNLYLTIQLLEMGVPIAIALNMMDVARNRGIEIDLRRLTEALGCSVVPVVAVTGEGTSELAARMIAVAEGRERGGFPLAHDEIVESHVDEIAQELADINDANRRWVALKLLENDCYAQAFAPPPAMDRSQLAQKDIEQRTGDEADIRIADTRFGHAHSLAQRVIRHHGRIGATWTDHIDRVVLGRRLGVPVFLAIMYVMFMFTINIGGAFVDFFDGAASAVFVTAFGGLLTDIGSPTWLRVLLANGVGGGITIVATFLPIVGALYLFLSVLEDSGYMARAAFVMDRFMRAIGLPGKAFVPLIVGFGCNVPAIMATRTLGHERERKLTILMNPFMSCGARLPVYALFAAAFFPTNGQNLVFALYVIGIVVAILTGLIMKVTLLSGESSGFMMELPPYHLPTVKGVMLRTLDRVRLFVKEAGQVIIIMVVVLNVLNSMGTDGSFDNEDTEKSVLSTISRGITPVFSPMGIREDNWPATLGIVSGVLAKEVVVGTLDTLYGKMAEDESAGAPNPAELNVWRDLRVAVATIPENLRAVAGALCDPLGMNVGEVTESGAAAEIQGVNLSTFGAMSSRFDGRIGAFAYLLFILLYFPCIATVGAIKREAGTAWAGFVAFWTTFVAYITASGFYQIATYAQHPMFSAAWLLGIMATLIALVLALRAWGRREEPARSASAEVGA